MTKLNHYYPAAIIAKAFSENAIPPLRECKVNALNLFELFKIIKTYKNNKTEFINYCISSENKKYLCSPIAEDILTDVNLIEESKEDSIIQYLERYFLSVLETKKIFEEDFCAKIGSIGSCTEKQHILNFIKLTLNRSPLVTYLGNEKYKIDENFVILNLYKDTQNLYKENTFSDMIPVVPIKMYGFYKNFIDLLELSNEELRILDTHEFYVFNYTPTHMLLIFNLTKEIAGFILNDKGEINGDFYKKIEQLYFMLNLVFTFRYIVYHKDFENEFINFALNYYYDTYENLIEYRKKLNFSSFQRVLHKK